jgi:hypothetical protein
MERRRPGLLRRGQHGTQSVAAYLVPNAFHRRVVLTMNLREAFHFCELRAAANAHFSIRRIARMADELRQAVLLLAGFIRLLKGRPGSRSSVSTSRSHRPTVDQRDLPHPYSLPR